jgi:hypothetical protein
MELEEVFERTGGTMIMLPENQYPSTLLNTLLIQLHSSSYWKWWSNSHPAISRRDSKAAVYCLQSDDSSDSINQAIDILSEIPPTPVPETGENCDESCDKNYAYAESLPDPSSKKLSSKKRKSPTNTITNTTTSSTADPFLHPSIVLSYAYLSLHLLQPSVTPLSLSLNSWPSNPSSLLLHASNLRSISSLLPSFLAYKKASQTSTSLLPLPQLEFVDLISVEDVINVRSKSTYMACLLGSLLGRHEEVEEMLKGFKVDWRIAPELWRLKGKRERERERE